MPASRSTKPALHITIVADNPETLDGLEAYLRRAGASTNGTRCIEKLADATPPSSSVVLLFPDDFKPDSVMSALATLRRRRPGTLPVLVTREPRRFESLPPTKGGIVPLVVPKPVWGWTILDAIRTRLESEPPSERRG